MTFSSSFLPLDGVEFKLSDSLNVPTVEGLSSDFRLTDPTALLLEYDFTKEKEALSAIDATRKSEAKMAEEEEKRKQLSLKRREDNEKLKLQEMMDQQREVLQRQRELFLEQKRRQQQQNIESGNQTPDRTSPSDETSESATEDIPPIPPRNPFLQVGNANILTPQPAARKLKDAPESPSRSSQSQPGMSGQNQIWVDFEEKELDPFSNMELKTIDDIAELETVLQNARLEISSGTSVNEPPSYAEISKTLRTETQIPNGAVELASTNPFLADITGLSSAPADNLPGQNSERTMSSSSHSPTFDFNNDDITPVANNHPRQDISQTTDDNTPHTKTDLYENISISEIKNIAEQLDRPPMRPPKTTPSSHESIYSFAQDSTSPEKEETLPISKIFERKMSQQFEESKHDDLTPVYSVVRPKTRGLKSPDSVVSSQNRPNPVTNSPTERIISPVLPPPSQFKPVQTGQNNLNPNTKVLPVSFSAVSNSNTPVLPPIPANRHFIEGNYVNIALGSISDPNLLSRPTTLDEKPPVPPRDRVGTSATGQAHNITSPSNATYSAPGNTHLYPPYALPQSNGSGVSITSSSSVGFTNSKPEMSPKRAMSAGNTFITDASFLQKTQEERAKFEATMNAALSSLPKIPKPVARKPVLPPLLNNTPPPLTKARPPSPRSQLLATLEHEEREFVNNITSMGFELETTIRAARTHGYTHDKVVDHLIRVQQITEQGFPATTVQDALDMFENDNKEVAKYLQQANQLIDMGFQETDVKNALKTHNNDQALALDQLMCST